MESCRLIIVLILQWLSLCQTVKLCPVSSHPNFASDGDHHYPLEIYDPASIGSTTISNCLVYDLGHQNYSCPTKFSSCPLIKENLIDGSLFGSNVTNLCSLKNALNDKKAQSRFVIFGGSVTTGVDSTGCCNAPECMLEHCRRCSWSHYLQHWLNSYSKANATVFNAGKAGTTTVFTSEIVRTLMFDVGITNLTSNDVIIIDHSFNDIVMGSTIKAALLERGLEKLIRELFKATESLSSIPHIIIFETDTRLQKFIPHHNMFPYIYNRQATHYGLRIFSYRNAVLSNNSVVLQSKYHDHITHISRKDDHPNWHIHLLYADFVVALLLKEFEQCSDSNTKQLVPYVVPAMLTNIDDVSYCDPKIPPLLKITHKDILANTYIGNYSIPREDTWKVRLDHKKRGGIIIELNNQSTFDQVERAPVSFSLGITVDQWRALPSDVVLQLQYMRSYVNSGYVSLFFCDDWIGDLDALWGDFKFNHYTLPDVHTLHLERTACNSKKTGSDEVVFRVEYVTQQFYMHDIKEVLALEPRTAQLFKIISVRICR